MESNFYYNRYLRPLRHDTVGGSREAALKRFDLERTRILRKLDLVRDAKNKLVMERLSLLNQLMKINQSEPGRQIEINIPDKSGTTDSSAVNHPITVQDTQDTFSEATSSNFAPQAHTSLSVVAGDSQTGQSELVDYEMELTVDRASSPREAGASSPSVLERMVEGDFCVED